MPYRSEVKSVTSQTDDCGVPDADMLALSDTVRIALRRIFENTGPDSATAPYVLPNGEVLTPGV